MINAMIIILCFLGTLLSLSDSPKLSVPIFILIAVIIAFDLGGKKNE